MPNITDHQYELLLRFLSTLCECAEEETPRTEEIEMVKVFLLNLHALVQTEQEVGHPVKLSVADILSEKERSFARKANRLMPKNSRDNN